MMDNNDLYARLRARYPEFVYEDYHWCVDDEGLRLWFDFRMGDVVFHPTALVERRPFLDFGTDGLDAVVFNIGMAELVSYWKCACPPTVRLCCGSLDGWQTDFWRKLYWNGLGEFYYTNGIAESPDGFMQIVGSGPAAAHPVPLTGCSSADGPDASFRDYLVPVGGGKDSVVTLELLRRAGKRIRPLIMNPRGATVECARVAGFAMDEVLVVRRSIDPTLLDLNRQGYLNGHTPFSAMLAFYTMLASRLSGIARVALSNESSANESTVPGTTVNHQYSKSLGFEDDFRNYVEHGMRKEGTDSPADTDDSPRFSYFSFLRPLSELQIAMLFSRCTAYHDVFRSCNVGSKQDIWCGHCPKCLFAYIILSPFIEPARLNRIFGKSMLDDLTLRPGLEQLLGLAATKPFECVGTVSEVRQALAMALRRWYTDGPPALLQGLDLPAATHAVALDRLLPEGNLNSEERKILQEACTEKTD